jgi:hypothetical protein
LFQLGGEKALYLLLESSPLLLQLYNSLLQDLYPLL